MNIKDLIVSIYIWIVALFYNRAQQDQQLLTNNINNNNIQQQQQTSNTNNQQLNSNNNNNNPLQITIQQQQQQQTTSQPQFVNAFTNIDKKEPISYSVYKQRALDYLNLKVIKDDKVLESVIVILSEENDDDIFDRITTLLESLDNERAKRERRPLQRPSSRARDQSVRRGGIVDTGAVCAESPIQQRRRFTAIREIDRTRSTPPTQPHKSTPLEATPSEPAHQSRTPTGTVTENHSTGQSL
ncbi:hypothetical protein PPL_12033 [Heterostelium album PN500]|uniref:Uncharacterized protein n=1 Tax=Heterostelium pallidum (strain ATCC 26659 / Pp 5 / PN500) TaxID=670386 RepID=D3BLI0_HETP5|nr:hypothetical protein PPL_12033 [Heterostelium album PN500]EFA77431.1 hypothetical protein PPL_12033 [Heterostelium album PN500]|eukprot:XP_020429560.1 hypothetical protein PPL_12033 [Heterostelium album PN500]